jgi:hypothetical protein
VGPPNDASVEEKAQEEGRRKGPSTCLAESGEMAARANQRCKATVGRSSVEEEDSKPSLVTSSALPGSSPSQEVVQEEAAPESGEMAVIRTNQSCTEDTGSCNSVEEDGDGRYEDEEDSNPSLETSCALMGSSPSQENVQEEATGQNPSVSFWNASLENGQLTFTKITSTVTVGHL